MTRPRRPNLYLTGALRRKYGQLLGEARDLFADRARIKADLEHVGAVLRMFDPDVDLTTIKPIRPYREKRQRWSRDALAVLRKANEPMTARALANRVLTGRGVPLTVPNQQRVECSLHAVLERLEGRGVVRASEHPKRWAIEP